MLVFLEKALPTNVARILTEAFSTCKEICLFPWLVPVWRSLRRWQHMKQSKICIQKSFIMSYCYLDCSDTNSFLQVPVAWWSVSPHVTEHVGSVEHLGIEVPWSTCRFHPSFHNADLCLVHVVDVNQAIWLGEATEPLGGREWTGAGWWCQNNSTSYSPIPASGWRPCKKTRVVGNHLQVDGVSWQLGPCLQSVGVVPADTSVIVPCLGFLKFLDWWQWCDVDSADDGNEIKTISCWKPNTAKGKFNRSDVNASGLLPVNLLNALCVLAVLLVLLPAASLLPTDFLLEPSEKHEMYLVAYVILKLCHSRDRLLPSSGILLN